MNDASSIKGSGPVAWSIISDGDNKNFIMEAGTGSSTVTSSVYGLANMHAYSVLGAKQITDKDGKSRNLIQMRNPWGIDGQYKGNWNDNDSVNWTPNVA